MYLEEKPSNSSKDGKTRSLSEANLVTKPKAELSNLLARRSKGNWTHMRVGGGVETTSALYTPASPSFVVLRTGASERKLAASRLKSRECDG